MTNIQTAWIELFTVGGLGLLIIIIGVIIKLITNNNNLKCTSKTEGVVIKHRFLGEGRMHPVVEFTVNEKKFLTSKKFNCIKQIHIGGLPVQINEEAWEDEKGNLHVKTGPIANMRKLAETLWPLGSTMNVYYNSDKPKINYVDRPITNNFLFYFFLITGFVCIIISILIFFLMRL